MEWKEAFGKDADEFFHAWAVARYVGEVAAAGKAEYPLPLYANAALRDPISPGPTVNWESGGPTDDVLPIWKAAAPALDFLAPDIYMDDYAKVDKVMELYRRPDNPLLIPEISNAPHTRASSSSRSATRRSDSRRSASTSRTTRTFRSAPRR